MAHTLTFSTLHNYDPAQSGITIPVELSVGQAKVIVPDAKLDTGASLCIFQREYGEALGFSIESGIQERIRTATGIFLAYGHEVSLIALGIQIDVIVYFAALTGFNRNVLGRRGWIQHMRLGIIDYESKLYISAYDES
ncbi:MAG TPA: hypothetical protein VNO70_15450 [Blastocatellia bacterium]|nr:hypothetical protein [Blastocatellia bacterium]